MARAFLCGAAGVFPVLLLAFGLHLLARVGFIAITAVLRVLDKERAIRLERWLAADLDEDDFAPPSHWALLVVDACWLVGVWTTAEGACGLRGALAAGAAAAFAFHLLGRSRFYFVVWPVLFVVPSIVAGSVAAIVVR